MACAIRVAGEVLWTAAILARGIFAACVTVGTFRLTVRAKNSVHIFMHNIHFSYVP